MQSRKAAQVFPSLKARASDQPCPQSALLSKREAARPLIIIPSITENFTPGTASEGGLALITTAVSGWAGTGTDSSSWESDNQLPLPYARRD